MRANPSAAPRHWPPPPPPVPAIPEQRPPAESGDERDRREDVRVAAIVAGLMLFTALAATPFPTVPAHQVPVSIAR